MKLKFFKVIEDMYWNVSYNFMLYGNDGPCGLTKKSKSLDMSSQKSASPGSDLALSTLVCHDVTSFH